MLSRIGAYWEDSQELRDFFAQGRTIEILPNAQDILGTIEVTNTKLAEDGYLVHTSTFRGINAGTPVTASELRHYLKRHAKVIIKQQ
jgi:hypothetical protein